MTRYRSAMVLILFMLLGAAWHADPEGLVFPLILGSLALVFSYACSTSINDLADFDIDKINLSGHNDRPLVNGQGTKNDLVLIAIFSFAAALALGFTINILSGFFVLFLLAMNIFYSLPPLRISHHAMITPIYLAFGYAAFPYCLGVTIAGGRLDDRDLIFLPALFFLFLARISLKDFRDREGDAKFGKATLILKYGKNTVCALSLVSLIIGSALLLFSLGSRYWLEAGLIIYMAALLITEIRLAKARDRISELIAIGMGAKIGNAMFFILLGILMLQKSGATTDIQTIFYFSVTLVYGAIFWEYLRKPQSFRFGSQQIHATISKTG